MLFRSLAFLGLLTEKLFAQDVLAIANPANINRAGSVGAGLPVFEFQVYVNENDYTSISDDLLESHVFGQLVSRKLYILESKYTFQVPAVPGNPQTKTVIRKPVIYEAVKRIEHYLKKSVRKGSITQEAASITFNKVLDVAINAFAADSNNFENTISKTDDLASLINLFANRVILIS